MISTLSIFVLCTISFLALRDLGWREHPAANPRSSFTAANVYDYSIVADQLASSAENNVSGKVLFDVKQAMSQTNPTWSYEWITCTCGGIDSEQVSMTSARWGHRTIFLKKRHVTLYLYELNSAEAAERALNKTSKWQIGAGWRRESHPIADGGILFRNKSERRLTLWLRTGRFVGEIDGENIGDIRHVADLVIVKAQSHLHP